MRSQIFGCLLLASLLTARVPGQELDGIERTIAQEPDYESKSQRYCLLVFGPQAETKIWLVVDGDVLFVDRNGNGDLTEPDERVEATMDDSRLHPDDRTFEAGDLHAGQLVHKNLNLVSKRLNFLSDRDEQVKKYLRTNPNAYGYLMAIDVEIPNRSGIGLGGRVEHLVSFRDTNGFLKFGDKPENAPIINFGGPWKITIYDKPPTLKVGRESELYLALGTSGLGPGTTAYVGYESLVPDGIHPQVSIEYPSQESADQTIKELYELTGRC